MGQILLYFNVGELVEGTTSEIADGIYRLNICPKLCKFAVHCLTKLLPSLERGGVVASWLVRSTPERVLRVRALAWDIALCS